MPPINYRYGVKVMGAMVIKEGNEAILYISAILQKWLVEQNFQM